MTNTSNGRGLWEWTLVKTILATSLLLFASFLWRYGYTETGVRKIIRWTARIDVFLFCLAFAASALHFWGRNSLTFWITMNRRYWGISFAIIHLIHLGFLGLLQWSFHPVFEMAASISLFAGGLAYVFVILMLLTSFPMFAKKMSRENWKRLHTVGGYWIWFIFMSSYWKRVFRGEYGYLLIAVMLVGVFLLRVWYGWKSRIRKTA